MSEKKPRELFKERNQRVADAIALREPDRVPITPMWHFYPTEIKGISKKEAMYEREKYGQASIDLITEHKWDQASPLMNVWSGEVFDSYGAKFIKWPGAADINQRLEDHEPFQYVEAEYMKENEYEEFFYDPTGFLLRKVIPRSLPELKAFEEFPNIVALGYNMMTVVGISQFFGLPAGKKFLAAVQKGVESTFKFLGSLQSYEKSLKKLGYPVQFATMAIAPFDVVGDSMRGMRGSMIDMYRRPEELKKMIEMFIKPCLEMSIGLNELFPHLKVVFIPLHRGADGFMSNTQFESFYWPSLTKLMDGLINKGLIPMPFFEGGYNDRLEYLAEYAKKNKGKLIYWFDRTDMIEAKKIVGDYACMRGNIPPSLLSMGTPQQIEDHVKELIEGCAEGGGYIVDGGLGLPDEAKPENVKAMTDAVFKYGVYRK